MKYEVLLCIYFILFYFDQQSRIYIHKNHFTGDSTLIQKGMSNLTA